MILILPLLASAASIVPCGGYNYNEKGEKIGAQPPCDFDGLMRLVNNVLGWIVAISFPIAAGVFAWAGIKYMMTGVMDEKAAAKAMLWKVFWGFVFVLSAWIVVGTITGTFLKDDFRQGVDSLIENKK